MKGIDVFGFFRNMEKPRPQSDAEDALRQVRELLFPKLELRSESEGRFMIDRSVDNNLDAALSDLRDGYNDDSTQRTVSGVVERLMEVRRLLGVDVGNIPADVQHIVFDASTSKDPVEAIETREARCP